MGWTEKDLLDILRGNSWVWPHDVPGVIHNLAADLLVAKLAIRDRNKLISELEQRISRRKADITRLERSRRWEAETEGILKEALGYIAFESGTHYQACREARNALARLFVRTAPGSQSET